MGKRAYVFCDDDLPDPPAAAPPSVPRGTRALTWDQVERASSPAFARRFVEFSNPNVQIPAGRFQRLVDRARERAGRSTRIEELEALILKIADRKTR